MSSFLFTMYKIISELFSTHLTAVSCIQLRGYLLPVKKHRKQLNIILNRLV